MERRHRKSKKISKKTAILIVSIIGGVLLCSIGVNTYQWWTGQQTKSKLTTESTRLAYENSQLTEEQTKLTEQLSTLEEEKKALVEKSSQSLELLGKNDDDFPYSAEFPELYTDRIEPVSQEGKTVYLTFDDGPSKITTGILDTLKAENVKATFFVVGQSIDTYKDVLKRASDEGHTIGIHTYTHEYDKIYSSVSAYLEDFDRIFHRVTEITGKKPNVFRFPGGSINNYNRSVYQSIIAEMSRRGFTYYDWNVESGDATKKATKDKIIANVKSGLNYNSAVVLMHDAGTKEFTAEALPEVIKTYKDAGFQFETMEKRDSMFFPYRVD